MKREVITQKPKEWFEEWFDDTYLQVYHYRDPKEARRVVNWLASVCSELTCKDRVVDLACGAGRHAWLMAQAHGWSVTGLDLSPSLLTRARNKTFEQIQPLLEQAHPHAQVPAFVRGDLRRLPFADERFSLATSFFTSFGYFETDEQHRAALAEMVRILVPDGRLMMDLFNPEVVLRDMEPVSEGKASTFFLREARTLNEAAQTVTKTMTILFRNGETRNVLERVRYFFRDELAEWLQRAGLTPESWHGDYNGVAFDPNKSQRLIVLARKTT